MNTQLFNPDNEGINHINAYSGSRTSIGRLLSNFALILINHPKYGKFSSLEAYWYWLSSGKKYDILRDKHGFKAKQIGRSLGKVLMPEEEFRKEFLEGVNLKISNSKIIRDFIKTNELPIVHYYFKVLPESKYEILDQSKYDWCFEPYRQKPKSHSLEIEIE